MRLTFREVVLGFRRAPLLSTLSIVTIAFSMFALGLFGLVALNVSRALRGLEEHVEVRAFVSAGTPIETITTALFDRQVALLGILGGGLIGLLGSAMSVGRHLRRV